VQAARIAPSNPRALYFSDDVVVGYIRGAPFLEFATVDPKKGVEFYTLEQRASPTPRLFRGDRACLQCHESLQSMDVPGMLLRSVPTQPDGQILPQLGNYVTTHASPIDQRWGGWYVTGSIERAEHMGNMLIRDARDPNVKLTSNEVLTSLEKRFDQRGYLPDPRDPEATPPEELFIVAREGGDAKQLTKTGVNVSGVAWKPRAGLGGAAEEIVVAAIQEDVDLIVLSRRKKSALTRFFTRRIAETVSRNAPCPVLSIEAHQSTRSTPVWRVPVLGEIAESF